MHLEADHVKDEVIELYQKLDAVMSLVKGKISHLENNAEKLKKIESDLYEVNEFIQCESKHLHCKVFMRARREFGDEFRNRLQ